MIGFRVTGALALVCTASAAVAGGDRVVHPVQVGAETVRYQQGVATLDLEKPRGAVQVTPLPLDHGSLSFAVAVYNAGDAPANIDVTNFSLRAGTQELPVFSKDQLERKAKNRAMWTQIALAAIGGLGAAAAASQRHHYRSTFVTPRGTYRFHGSAPSAAGQVSAAVIAAGSGAGIARVRNQLDATREALGANIVQLTTADPGEGYAGQIVVAKIKDKALPQRVDMLVRWNGEEYPFAFQVDKRGTAAPVFTPPAAAPAQPTIAVAASTASLP